MRVVVQLRSAGTHEHEDAAHFEVRDNGVLYVYSWWKPHAYGTDYTLDTAYARDFWQCVVRK
jgi:hypothetical protein